MPPCYCRHANCNGTDISDNKHSKHRIEDEKTARMEARRANRVQKPANNLHIQVSNLSLHSSPNPALRERAADTQFETSISATDIKLAQPAHDEWEATRIRELYQSLVAIDIELHEHLHILANTIPLPLDRLVIEEAWFQGTLQRLQAVKTRDKATALVLASMLDNAVIGMKDLTARREETEKIEKTVNTSDYVYDTGMFPCKPR